MRTVSLILLALASFVCASALGQQAPEARILIDEADGWRVHAGNSPADSAAAAPGFDDSRWQEASFGSDLPDALLVGNSRWFRKRIELPPGSAPVDLLLTGTLGSFEIFLDGQRTGAPIRSSMLWQKRQEIIVPLRAARDASRASVEIAIHSRLYFCEFSDSLNFESATIGDPAAIALAAQAHRGERLGKLVFPTAVMISMVVAALLILTLFFQQPAHQEYLWLGLSLLFFGLTTGLPAIDIQGGLPYAWNAFVGDPCTYFFIAAQLQFIFRFIGSRPGPLVRLYQITLVVTPLPLNVLLWFGLLPNLVLEWVEDTLTLPAMVLILIILVRSYRRGNREAGLLIVPTILANAAGFLFGIEIILQAQNPNFALPSLQFGLVHFSWDPLLSVPYLISLGILIFFRFGRISSDQAQAQAELESARTIQQLLIPEALHDLPGFRIESIYQPAQQVGGDFFQILPTSDGGVLAVLGDVSGKGLPAAMNVALLVGTLRTLAETTSDPAQILAGLNRRLLGRSRGFTTAVAVRIAADGQACFAIAGHLNPYLNGRELTLDPGLPLGLTAEADYANTSLTLTPGDLLTLLTDGVLEARNPKTQELFGFDRTLAISSQPARAIAQAAQAFGQDDDIAVLTLVLGG